MPSEDLLHAGSGGVSSLPAEPADGAEESARGIEIQMLAKCGRLVFRAEQSAALQLRDYQFDEILEKPGIAARSSISPRSR